MDELSTVSKQVVKKLAYQPQVNTPADDDPDSYMMLVPAARKRPTLQISCAILGIIFAIAGLCKDEISDGDVRFDKATDDFLDEVDYDCGWDSFRVNYWYYEENTNELGGYGNQHWAEESFVFQYSGSFCADHDKVDADFCVVSARNGTVWLVMGIIGIIGFVAAIPVVWFQGKASKYYPICMAIGTLILSIGSFQWFFNDKCEDVEKWPQEDVTFKTSVGVSLILVWVSVFFGIIGILISSIHLMTPIRKRRQQRAEQAHQPRIQTHVVANN
eukprot:408827_1